MNISLTPTLEGFVQKQISNGFYISASEVVREGLRLLEEKEKFKAMKLKDLRHELQKGIDSLDRGEGRPADQVFKKLKKKYDFK